VAIFASIYIFDTIFDFISSKLFVSFAKELYKTDRILQKRPIISRSLLIVATPYLFRGRSGRDYANYYYSYFFFFDGYCSTVQGLLDWFEVDLGFTEFSFIQYISRKNRGVFDTIFDFISSKL